MFVHVSVIRFRDYFCLFWSLSCDDHCDRPKQNLPKWAWGLRKSSAWLLQRDVVTDVGFNAARWAWHDGYPVRADG